MTISRKTWEKYIAKLRKLNETAANRMTEYLKSHDTSTNEGVDAAVEVAYALATKYGEGAAALSCEMYDAVAAIEGVPLPAAEPAATATYEDAAKTVWGIMKHSDKPESVGSGVGRLVKMAGVDTTIQNGMRDGAQFAWVPHGDTCAFCLMLASNGWRNISKKALKKGHAEHIHSNCDCTYAIRHDGKSNVAGYDPEKYRQIFDDAEGDTWREKLDSIRREQYAEQKEVAELKNKYNPARGYVFANPGAEIEKFEKRVENLKKEQAIYVGPDGEIFSEGKGGARGVRIDHPTVAGYTFSHNHPAEANFSVADVSNFEKYGVKQIRAVSPKITYVLEAESPVRKDDNERYFSIAMNKEWQKLDEESLKKRKEINSKAMKMPQGSKEKNDFVQDSYKKLVEWRNKSESDWLKANAPKYGYHYKKIVR